MSGVEPRSKRGGLRLALLAVLVLGAAAVLYVMAQSLTTPGAGEGIDRYAKASLHRLRAPETPRRAPGTPFVTADGRTLRITDLPGELVVVNLWATWCAPCVAEMPTLAALQKAYPGRVHVAAVSLDRPADAERARLFLARHAPLVFYHDPNFAMAGAVAALGLPTTLIYGADGLEIARVTGPAEWDSPEVRRLLDHLLER
jgi:thiol-disulfide isomerase/thioredoxin